MSVPLPPRVRVRMAYKINMGNYETLDLDYEIEDNVREGEKVKDAHDRVKGLVNALLADDVEGQKKSLGSKGVRRS